MDTLHRPLLLDERRPYEMLQSAIRSDPEAALLWVSQSQRYLTGTLAERGCNASQKLVGRLLRRLGFSLEANSKTRCGGTDRPDRNAQLEYINAKVRVFQAAGHPPQAFQRLCR